MADPTAPDPTQGLNVAPIPAGGAYTTTQPIGIRPGTSPGHAPPSGPPYYPGDETSIAQALGAQDLATLQLELKQLGFIPAATKLQLGQWGATEGDAFRQVLGWANAAGVDWRAALSDITARSQAVGSFNQGPTQARLAQNPLDFKPLVDQEATSILGRGLTPGEQSSVTGGLSAAEAPSLQAGSTVAPPTATGFQQVAKDRIRALDPVRADSRSAVKVASVIEQMLGGHLPSTAGNLPSSQTAGGGF